LIKLSEQNLIDCNKDYNNGNFGCNGGNMLIAYNYIKVNNGISKSAVYPYRGSDIYSCAYNPSYSVTSVLTNELIPAGNENLVLLALIAIGPLSCAIDASLPSFQNYVSGVYSDPLCTRVLNHAIL
jgi:Papain family cysteine protease